MAFINKNMNYPAPDSNILRKQERVVLITLFLAASSFLPILAVALLSGSMLLLSDMLDYGRVIISSLLGWRILRSVRKGRAYGFDYGTGKLQTLGGMAGAVLYVVTMLIMAGLSIRHLMHPIELVTSFTMLGALFQLCAFAVSTWLWIRKHRLARAAFSPVMEMQWRASRAGALSCLGVFLGLILTLALRRFTWSVYLDPICALVFIIYTLISFIPVLANGINDLLDKTLQEDLQLRIDRHLADNFDDYAGFHGVRSRRSGGRIFIEIALSFRHDQPVGKAVETSERLRRGIESDIPGSQVNVVLLPTEPLCTNPKVKKANKIEVQNATRK
jgi:ferrous-iron efflux pump FieF